jgi:hypothetical protein
MNNGFKSHRVGCFDLTYAEIQPHTFMRKGLSNTAPHNFRVSPRISKPEGI